MTPAAGAAVPLLLGETTWGNLGFLHFNLHAWVPAEINALQAVASMLVQLQAPDRRRGAHSLQRQPRRVDGPAEPAGPCPRAQDPSGREPQDRRHGHRPGPLQGDERLSRARHG